MGLLVGGLMDLYILAHGAVMALYRCILRVGEGLNKKNAPLCDFICFSSEKRSPLVFLFVHLVVYTSVHLVAY